MHIQANKVKIIRKTVNPSFTSRKAEFTTNNIHQVAAAAWLTLEKPRLLTVSNTMVSQYELCPPLAA